jgi:hypothetical protein
MKMLPKVMIGHPVWRTNLTTNFYLGMIDTITSYYGPLDIKLGQKHSVAWARNNLIEQFLESDAEYLFLVDADMGVPREGLKTLVEHDLPIVGAFCFRRDPPYEPTLMIKTNQKINEQTYLYENMRDYPDGLMEVHATGGACLLIKREVLEKVTSPWFYELDGVKSEDIYFCEKVREAGYKIYVDTTVKTSHATDLVITPTFQDSYKNS